MKKLFIVMIVFAGAMTSCKKSYTCECEATTALIPTPTKANVVFTDTKSNAKEQCKSYEENMHNTYVQLGGGFTCELK